MVTVWVVTVWVVTVWVVTHNKCSCAFGLVLPGPEALDKLPCIPQGTNQVHNSPDVVHQYLVGEGGGGRGREGEGGGGRGGEGGGGRGREGRRGRGREGRRGRGREGEGGGGRGGGEEERKDMQTEYVTN